MSQQTEVKCDCNKNRKCTVHNICLVFLQYQILKIYLLKSKEIHQHIQSVMYGIFCSRINA